MPGILPCSAYDATDWQPRGEMPADSPVEEYWRGEVAARNAMIELLYDRLGLPPANSFVEKPPKSWCSRC